MAHTTILSHSINNTHTLTSLATNLYLRPKIHRLGKMALPHLALFIQPRPLHGSSCLYLWPLLNTTMEHSDYQAFAVRFCNHNTFVKCLPTSMFLSSGTRLHPVRAVSLITEATDSSITSTSSESNSYLNSPDDGAQNEVLGIPCDDPEPMVINSVNELKEIQRRRRIGLANKGKVPWNKGKKHSPETCARIKEKTLEALRDPKVRKKMSEAPRLHSEESKKKISSSLRQLWTKRLKTERSRERFYSSWAESVAEAARRGGINEIELNWDSYERLKGEIASRELQRATEKAKRKELKKIEAEERARERAEKMALLAQKKMERKLKAKPRAKQKKIVTCKARKAKEELALSKEKTPKDKLTKAAVMTYLQLALEKFDIESIKQEQERKTVSLADQIQAAKSRRIQVAPCGSAKTSSVED